MKGKVRQLTATPVVCLEMPWFSCHQLLPQSVPETLYRRPDLLVSQLITIVQADPNQLAQFRRVNCRYCWGENHLYQWRDIAEFDKAAAQASRDGKPEPEYGGLGFVDNAIPNSDCPKCCGEGTGQLYMADTTLLDGDVRQLYAGAKLGKFGVEILQENKAAARRELLRLLSAGGALCADKRLQELEIERRRMENQKLRKEIETVEGNEHPRLWRSILM